MWCDGPYRQQVLLHQPFGDGVQGKEEVERKQVSICSVEGCGKKSRNVKGRLLCEAHYMRLRRKGTTDLKPPKSEITHSHGYVIVRCPDHPLALRLGRNHAYQHRVVFYDANGEGPFDCHWCGEEVDWDTLHVDHLDDVKTHNDPLNLVASCPTCNQARGVEKMKLSSRHRGLQITHDGLTLNVQHWADKTGLKATTIKARLASGWSPDKALTTPARAKRPDGTGPRAHT